MRNIRDHIILLCFTNFSFYHMNKGQFSVCTVNGPHLNLFYVFVQKHYWFELIKTLYIMTIYAWVQVYEV